MSVTAGSHHRGTAVTAEDRARYGRRAQLLAGVSVAYNGIEAVIAITAGILAGSVALVGFGLDSIVEVSSGLIIVWQFRHPLPESRERTALRLMALSFFGLAAYVAFESTRALVTGHDPDTSTVGIALACVSLATMPFLSWAQRRTGRALGSDAVVADSIQTSLCTYMSAVLLMGLLHNALSAGPGPTPSPDWSSPPSPSAKASRHGAGGAPPADQSRAPRSPRRRRQLTGATDAGTELPNTESTQRY